MRNASEAEKVQQLVDNKNEELEDFNKNKSHIVSELEKARGSVASARAKAMEEYNRRKRLEQQLNDEKIPEITAYKHKIDRLQNVKLQKIEVSNDSLQTYLHIYLCMQVRNNVKLLIS